MKSKPETGQIWRQNRTPREGDEALWTITQIAWACHHEGASRVSLSCVGTDEEKTILLDSLKRDYDLYEMHPTDGGGIRNCRLEEGRYLHHVTVRCKHGARFDVKTLDGGPAQGGVAVQNCPFCGEKLVSNEEASDE